VDPKQPEDIKRDVREQRRRLKASEAQFKQPLLVVQVTTGAVIRDRLAELLRRWRP